MLDRRSDPELRYSHEVVEYSAEGWKLRYSRVRTEYSTGGSVQSCGTLAAERSTQQEVPSSCGTLTRR